jgi:hypothetical protein
MSHPYPTFMAAEKAISVFPGWSEPEPETGYVGSTQQSKSAE